MKLSKLPIQVIIDSREKRPLLFPATLNFRGRLYTIETIRRRLDAGDYMLEHAPQLAGIERKAGLREIHQNFLTTDSRRAHKALVRFAGAYEHPLLLLESSTSQLMTPTKYFPRPGGIVQQILDACADLKIGLLLVGRCAQTTTRRKAGELALRALLAYTGPPR